VKWDDLSNWANIVTIVGLPVTIFTWLFTRESFAKFWKKWGKMIFGVTAVLCLVGVWRLGWFNWLGYKISIGWILASIALLVVIAGITLWFLSQSPKNGSNVLTDWKAYVSDEIFELRWNWRYIHNQIDEDYFSAFCPRKNCKHRLDINDDLSRLQYHSGGHAPVVVLCPRCGFTRNFDWSRHELIRRVAGEVERRINTGQFTKSKD
jgi:hypothetical protein